MRSTIPVAVRGTFGNRDALSVCATDAQVHGPDSRCSRARPGTDLICTLGLQSQVMPFRAEEKAQ